MPDLEIENEENNIEDNEPCFEPETCNEGGFEGVECEIVNKEGSWWCMTCNKYR